MSMLEMPDEPEHDGIDLQLEDWAREGGLRVLHLENLPEQLAALDCVPAAEYAAVLGQRLRAGWSFEEEAARDRKSTRLTSSHQCASRLTSSACTKKNI